MFDSRRRPGFDRAAGTSAILLVVLCTLLTACGSAGESPRPAASGEIATAELAERLEAGEALVLLDVRTPGEFHQGHIEGAINIPVYSLDQRLDELEEFRDRTVVAYCEVGPRAVSAVRTLEANGFADVVLYRAGMSEWRRLAP
jgi:rhodanese-related sulfurtransferase